MIINTTALDTPRDINMDEVVQAAYLGIPMRDLAHKLGVPQTMLGRWLGLHFPQYTQVQRGTREAYRAIEEWREFLKNVEFDNLPEGMQHFIGMTFPPYVWMREDRLYDHNWLRNFRYTLYRDRKFLELYLKRTTGQLQEREYTYVSLRRRWGTKSLAVMDLLWGLIEPGSREEARARKLYGAVLVEKGGLYGAKQKPPQTVKELHRLWLSEVHGKRWIDQVRRSSFYICEDGPDRWHLRFRYRRRGRYRGRYWHFRQFGNDYLAQLKRKDRRRGGVRRRARSPKRDRDDE